MHTLINSLRPKFFWNATLSQEAPYHVENGSIFRFWDTILLWCICCCCQLHPDSMIYTKSRKFIWAILSIMVCSKRLNSLFRFYFNSSFEAFKWRESFRFFLQKIDPSFSWKIICESNEVFFTSIGRRIYWTTYIWMNQFQNTFCSPWLSIRELRMMLFANNTFFTNLRRSSNLGKGLSPCLFVQGSLIH